MPSKIYLRCKRLGGPCSRNCVELSFLSDGTETWKQCRHLVDVGEYKEYYARVK
jgi:hypothetical protein